MGGGSEGKLSPAAATSNSAGVSKGVKLALLVLLCLQNAVYTMFRRYRYGVWYEYRVALCAVILVSGLQKYPGVSDPTTVRGVWYEYSIELRWRSLFVSTAALALIARQMLLLAWQRITRVAAACIFPTTTSAQEQRH